MSSDMKVCKCCGTSKIKFEFYKSSTTKDGHISKCKSCFSAWNSQNYKKNLNVNRNKKRDYYYENHESEKGKRREHYRNNKAKYLYNYYVREENIRQSTPIWLSIEMKNQIKSLYLERQQLTEQTGVLHHVDHIVPINNEIVCGLNVPWNMHVITAEENLKKSNKFKDE